MDSVPCQLGSGLDAVQHNYGELRYSMMVNHVNPGSPNSMMEQQGERNTSFLCLERQPGNVGFPKACSTVEDFQLVCPRQYTHLNVDQHGCNCKMTQSLRLKLCLGSAFG